MRLQIEGLQKTYGTGRARHEALADVDLAVADGEFVAIVGTSGSGKTTLLNIVGGLDRGYTGRVDVDGRSLAEMNERQLARLRNVEIGFVFQQFNLLDHLTAAENVALPAFFSDDKTDRARRRACDLLERFGLGDRVDDRPPKLSGGQKQRVAIARALFHSPSLILCDEPTGSLDRKTGVEILEVLRDLNAAESATLVVVTHEEHIARLARRIVRMEDGRIVADEPNEPVEPDELGLLGLGEAAPADLVDEPSGTEAT